MRRCFGGPLADRPHENPAVRGVPAIALPANLASVARMKLRGMLFAVKPVEALVKRLSRYTYNDEFLEEL